jgi:Holliday junction resolvase RusA-like endonuclease
VVLPTTRSSRIVVTIPGDPVAQGRGRAVRFGASVRIIDPAKSRSWKGAAQVHMLAARQAAGVYSPFDEALFVTVVATWARPKSHPKKDPPEWRTSRPDADNIGKAVLDAGNGTLWQDDSSVVRLVVEKRYGAVSCVVVEVAAALAARNNKEG